jgi:hypothetical protein
MDQVRNCRVVIRSDVWKCDGNFSDRVIRQENRREEQRRDVKGREEERIEENGRAEKRRAERKKKGTTEG